MYCICLSQARSKCRGSTGPFLCPYPLLFFMLVSSWAIPHAFSMPSLFSTPRIVIWECSCLCHIHCVSCSECPILCGNVLFWIAKKKIIAYFNVKIRAVTAVLLEMNKTCETLLLNFQVGYSFTSRKLMYTAGFDFSIQQIISTVLRSLQSIINRWNKSRRRRKSQGEKRNFYIFTPMLIAADKNHVFETRSKTFRTRETRFEEKIEHFHAKKRNRKFRKCRLMMASRKNQGNRNAWSMKKWDKTENTRRRMIIKSGKIRWTCTCEKKVKNEMGKIQ